MILLRIGSYGPKVDEIDMEFTVDDIKNPAIKLKSSNNNNNNKIINVSIDLILQI